MTQIVRIKPAGRLYVRHPDNGHRHLAEEGEDVVMNAWWHRRLADKEIVIVQPVEVDSAKPQFKESK